MLNGWFRYREIHRLPFYLLLPTEGEARPRNNLQGEPEKYLTEKTLALYLPMYGKLKHKENNLLQAHNSSNLATELANTRVT